MQTACTPNLLIQWMQHYPGQWFTIECLANATGFNTREVGYAIHRLMQMNLVNKRRGEKSNKSYYSVQPRIPGL